jgi:hypothetical protein
MFKPLTSHKRAKAISLSLLLVGLAILSYLKEWWPGIMLVIGIPLALRQYLLGRPYDTCLSIVIFVGVFLSVYLNASWEIILPVLFILGAIYIFFREFLEKETPTEEEKEEDINLEIEESKEESQPQVRKKDKTQ